ncbi:flagellar motor protein MotB [Halopseudomonas pelagia]|uniref:flagellar motor protein MotB n=1 Tax=Halopseudomonas pelagia TaxID=553151 RepID=UPI00039BFDF0|nr:flagellar motor protein MotB [Halopseudomonas pelagia]
MDNNQPIIVKRISRKGDGHHGGAWKIAFADFAVAMMAFFLVMWLMSTATPEQLKMISGYFNDPIGFSAGGSPFAIDLGGTPTVSPDRTLNESDAEDTEPLPLDAESIQTLAEQVEQLELDMLLQELQNKIDIEPVLQRFKDQILLEITQDGLRIQIVDAENRPMFASGSAQLQPYFEEILLALSDTIAVVPKKISIGGHTDAQPFVGRRNYGNWELSTERANAARRTLLVAGYPERQLARVVGYADSALFDRNEPTNPINRRIDIIVLNKRAEENIIKNTGDGMTDDAGVLDDAPLEPVTTDSNVPSGDDGGAPLGSPPAPPTDNGQRPANLFDDVNALEPLRNQ